MIKRTLMTLAAGSAMLMMTAASASAQDARLGDLALAGMKTVCVPVIEQGESLSETAAAEGFVELSDDDKAELGAPADISWWAFESTDKFLVVGRSLVEAGAPCRILTASTVALSDGIADDIADWLDDHRSGFELVRVPEESDGPDRLWVWERVGGGTVQQLQMHVTHQKDDSVTAILGYGLLPQTR